MAIIDKTYYSGTDQYSDGDTEEENLLRIVREGKRLSDLPEQDVTWPVFYHLSPFRENICSWFPFEPGARVLEIGAGCGAVTGALCGKGLKITSVDLSLRRTQINYERHKDCDDLVLMVGNLNEISFSEQFDYILLIGVLEYAGRFTERESPYKQFLVNIRKLLKPEGKLLLAIENRMGLKYFAGAPEDHLGIPFSGLKGYNEETGIRTFSKSELTRLLETSGFKGHRFYYPYPDYKFPQEIFTDETLISQHYGKPYMIFDRERVEVFPEFKVASVLAEDGAAGALSNSFLVEASINELPGEELQVYYAKLNSGRKEEFRIGTILCGNHGLSSVIKYAQDKAAETHIRNLSDNETVLSRFHPILNGKLDEKRIIYPFCGYSTLEDILQEAVRNNDPDCIKRVFKIIRELSVTSAREESYDSEAFTHWFGTERTGNPVMFCTKPANVDMAPDNIFTEGDSFILFDCEWVTNFQVPVSFIVWRSVENTYLRIPEIEKILSKEMLVKELGIYSEDIPVFKAWSWHFENHYVTWQSNTPFAKEICPAMYSPAEAEKRLRQLTQSEQSLKEEIEWIHHTWSWRLTRGFRVIYRFLTGKGRK